MGSDAGNVLSGVVRGTAAVMTAGISENYLAGQAGAKAAGDAANATYGQQQADRAEARRLAEPSPMEMQQLEQAINTNTTDIARKQRLLDSSDPALIEAGHQALSLMNGQDAKTLDPIRKQRARERDVMAQRLQAQLGSGWETSTAGIQAMRQFDESTDTVLANAQQQSLGQLLGVAQNTQGYGNTGSNVATSQNIANQRGNINVRQINALTGNRVDPGLQYAGDIAGAKNAQQTWGSVTNMAGQLIGGAMGGGGGGTMSTMGGPQYNPSPGTAGTTSTLYPPRAS